MINRELVGADHFNYLAAETFFEFINTVCLTIFWKAMNAVEVVAFEMIFGDIVGDIRSASDMHEAVVMAFYTEREEYKVLFSPAVENGQPYEEQGDAFKREVNEL